MTEKGKPIAVQKKEKKVKINIKSFSDSRLRPLILETKVENLSKFLALGGSKLHLKAVKAFKELEHQYIVPIRDEEVTFEDGMTIILSKRDEKIPSCYKLLRFEPLKGPLPIKKPTTGRADTTTGESPQSDIDADIEPPMMEGLVTEILVESQICNGAVGKKENSAYVQFSKGQAGRIVGRYGVVVQSLQDQCPPNTRLHFDSTTNRMIISADDENHLLDAVDVVLQERSSIEAFGTLRHPCVREAKIEKGTFGPVMGIAGKIKHDIQARYSVRLAFDFDTFVVRVVGTNHKDVDAALHEVKERLGTRVSEASNNQVEQRNSLGSDGERV